MRRIQGLALTLPVLAGAFGFAVPALAEEPEAWGVWTLPPVSPIMEQIEAFHNLVTVIIICIAVVVFGLLGYTLIKFRASVHPVPEKFTHNTTLEVIWTIIPVIILVGVAFPSFRLLYAQSRVKDADLTLKVVGQRFSWNYIYPDSKNKLLATSGIFSNLVPDSQLKPGEPRLLTADHPAMLPVGKVVRILVTSQDVIHSFSIIPAGVKVDAVPGRINETWTRIDQAGTYYGQCSQLCGENHGFMPIEVIAVPPEEFAKWEAGYAPSSAALPAGAVRFAEAAEVQR